MDKKVCTLTHYIENIAGHIFEGYICSICGDYKIEREDKTCPNCKSIIDWTKIKESI
jgi:rubrerythrin